MNNYRIISFPKHSLFLVNNIKNKNKVLQESKKIITDTFFYSKKLGFILEPYQMREIAQKYMCDIVDFNLNTDIIKNNLSIHTRGGDAMNKGVFLLQNPLKLYKLFINSDKYNSIKIVYEDNINPTTEHLKSLKNNKVSFQSLSVKKDLETLCSAENLLMSLSTFSLAVYFLSKNIKHIFIPKFMSDLWYPNMDWGLDTTKINFEDYTVENWKKLSTKEKQILLLSYNKEIII